MRVPKWQTATAILRPRRPDPAEAGSSTESASPTWATNPESSPGSHAIAGSAGVSGNHIDHRGHRRVDRLVLPEPDHGPARLVESGVGGSIPVDVAAQL